MRGKPVGERGHQARAATGLARPVHRSRRSGQAAGIVRVGLCRYRQVDSRALSQYRGRYCRRKRCWQADETRRLIEERVVKTGVEDARLVSSVGAQGSRDEIYATDKEKE